MIARGCVGGVGEPRDGTWFDADVCGSLFPERISPCISKLTNLFLFSQLWLQYNPTDDTYPHVYEQALDRLAFVIGGKAVLPAAFQHIPLASHNWKLWHAGLMAITSVAEGAGTGESWERTRVSKRIDNDSFTVMN